MKKEKKKIFGYKVRDPSIGKFLTKGAYGSWTSRGAIWTRKFDAVNAIKRQIEYGNKADEALTWEIVELVEGGVSPILFELNRLSS